jgi:hypothetical protein
VVTTGTHISDRERLWQEANVTFLADRTRLRKFYSYCLYFTDDKGYLLSRSARQALSTGRQGGFTLPGGESIE